MARQLPAGGEDGRLADAVLRDRLTQIELDQLCLDLTLSRSRDRLKAGQPPGPETSIFKLYGTELNQRRRELMMDLAGPQGLGWEGPGFERGRADPDARLAALARQHRSRAARRRSSSTSSPSACSAFRIDHGSSHSPKSRSCSQRTAREFVQGKSSFSASARCATTRRATASRASCGARWRQLGWLGIVVPEEYGGAGLGWIDLMVVLEELGRGLMPEPVTVERCCSATTALLLGGSAGAAAGAPAGRRRRRAAARAGLPGGRQPLRHQHVETRAERAGDGWRLAGEKIQVLDGHVADVLVVSARTAGGARDADGVTLFLVPRDATGLTVERQRRVDARSAALVRLDGVTVGAADVLGAVGDGGGDSSAACSIAPPSGCAPRCWAAWRRASR